MARALAVEDLVDVAVAAEDAGFDSAWVTDHLIVPTERADVYGTIAEALVSLSFLAARTDRLELGTTSPIGCWRGPSGRIAR
ncbi:MAG: LLM class flavin-dependent oxidoreductase [Gaiellaceae bacterium]